MLLNPEKIKKNLPEADMIRVFDSIDSTNSEAKRRAAEYKGKTVLYAASRQSAGRGRRGHSFYSPDGGLYMTLSLPPKGDPAEIQRLTCAAAVAVCEAVASLTGQNPSVKWVNDIYVNGRKVAGILSELVLGEKNTPTAVIVGVGINLTTTAFPEEFAARAGSLGSTDPDLLCAEIAKKLIDLYNGLSDNSIIEKYAALNFCIGHTVTYTDRDGSHTAEAVSIASDGSLIVEENGIQKALNSGEISVIPQ